MNPYLNIESLMYIFKHYEERKTSRGSLVWDGDKAKFKPDKEGRFIIGIDPYRKYKWWQKVLIFLRLRKKDKSVISVFRKNDDGSLEFIK